MDGLSVTLFIISFVAILGLLIWLRVRSNQFEVKPTEVVVAVLPVAIFLFATGKIQKVEVGGVKVETAIVNASASAITTQVQPLKGLSTEPLQIDPKSGVEVIPQLIEKKTQGLMFRLGRGGYYGAAIVQYLVTLTKQPFLRYIIIENSDSTFFAIADARALAELLSNDHPPFSADEFASWLDNSDKGALKQLPGFISADNAVNEKADRGQALSTMENLNVDNLPVVNGSGRFVGIVNRSQLTASLILDVTKELKH